MLVYVAELDARLSRARPLARPAGLQLPADRHLRRRDAARSCRGQPHASRRRRSRSSRSRRFVIVLAARCSGFGLRVIGEAPRGGALCGLLAGARRLLAFAISGALAGLAGICRGRGPDRAAPARDLAGLRLHRHHRRLPRPAAIPMGILVAGLVLALTYHRRRERRRSRSSCRSTSPGVFQGMLLFCVLACDALILYRVRASSAPARAGRDGPPSKRSSSPSSPPRRRCSSRRSASSSSSARASSTSASRA